MCSHRPPCPSADHRDRDAAHTVAFHPEQGWSLPKTSTGKIQKFVLRDREWTDQDVRIGRA
jgi:acyl-coenzyme A synthetase/AMP-(fatty) acid ligase